MVTGEELVYCMLNAHSEGNVKTVDQNEAVTNVNEIKDVIIVLLAKYWQNTSV